MPKIQPIDAAIDSYGPGARDRAEAEPGSAAPTGANEAYSSDFMAEMYAPRVRDLLGLKAEGHTHAEWKPDPELGGISRWHGVTPNTADTNS